MSRLWQIRIVILIALLVGVLTASRSITPHKVSTFFQSVGMDLDAGGRVGPRPTRLTLCQTRVHAIKWPDGRKIEEFKEKMRMKWLAYDPEGRELSYLEMEKWLGQNCTVRGTLLSAEDLPAQAQWQKFEIEFITGTPLTIERAGDLFRIQGQIYRSQELATAWEKLERLAGWRS